MFIIDIEYTVEFDKVDPLIAEHFEFLKKYYDAGLFVVSGRKEPRTGGIILVKNNDRKLVEKVMKEDPFYRGKVANYTLTEFVPGTAAGGFESLKDGLE
jgi:uncharacterized protein YciI